jgi:hypothetical protein
MGSRNHSREDDGLHLAASVGCSRDRICRMDARRAASPCCIRHSQSRQETRRSSSRNVKAFSLPNQSSIVTRGDTILGRLGVKAYLHRFRWCSFLCWFEFVPYRTHVLPDGAAQQMCAELNANIASARSIVIEPLAGDHRCIFKLEEVSPGEYVIMCPDHPDNELWNYC